MLGPQPAPAGAMCAAHPEAAADSVCARCGNFMCSTCSDKRQGSLCPACRESMGTWPLQRDSYDFNQVWGLVYAAWRRDLVLLGVAALIMSGLGVAGQLVMQFVSMFGQVLVVKQPVAGIAVIVIGMFAGIAVTVLVQGIGVMGLIRVGLDSLLGRKVEIPRVFSQTRKVWRYGALQLIIGAGVTVPVTLGLGLIFVLAVLVGGGSLTSHGIKQAFESPAALALLSLGVVGLMVVLVWLTIPLTIAQFELVYDDDCSAVDALKRAWELGNGHRLSIFGYSMLGALILMGLIFVGLLALCVGVMVAAPVGYALLFMLQAGLFLTLRNGSGLPQPTQR